jgi:hypothetical protein
VRRDHPAVSHEDEAVGALQPSIAAQPADDLVVERQRDDDRADDLAATRRHVGLSNDGA